MGSSLDTGLPAPWDFIPQGCEQQTLLSTSLLVCGVLLQAELTQVLTRCWQGHTRMLNSVTFTSSSGSIS